MASAPSQKQPNKLRIGEILIKAGVIDENQLAEALVDAQKNGLHLGFVLVRNGYITSEQLGQALSVQFNTKYISIAKMDPSQSSLSYWMKILCARTTLFLLVKSVDG